MKAGGRPYRQVARAEAQERNREALLQAAEAEFAAGRWQRTSLEALAAKAGVTKQTLLRHFGSKDGLLLLALMRERGQIREQRFSVPVGDVGGIVENLLDHYEAWGERSLRVGAWLAEGPALLAAVSKAARHVHYQWVEHAFGPFLEGLGEPARARRRAALIALCDVHTWWLFSHDLGLARAEVRGVLVDSIERLLVEDR